MLEKITEQCEKILGEILNDGITSENIDKLYKIIDIHKDIANECYWKEKEDYMRYRMDDSYGRRRRDSRGRYMENRGERAMNDMHDQYQNYAESREYNDGSYRGEEETIKSLDYMLKSMVQFVEMLQEEATTQEEVDLIKKYTRKISDM